MSAEVNPVNHWPHKKCAKAFWTQRQLPPYRWLLRDTVAWLDPFPGERWLDLGCGSGELTRNLWQKSQGTLRQIVALDCAEANARSIADVCRSVVPTPQYGQISFQHHNFSQGLHDFADCSMDGAVSGLAIQYAESHTPEHGWTTDAYDHLLCEINRVLRPGGRFVFSVNVPQPSWLLIGLLGIPGFFVSRKPLRYVRDSMRMLHYGSWLHREARRGRFHYLPQSTVQAKLTSAGFTDIKVRRSFAGQAFLFRCRRGRKD